MEIVVDKTQKENIVYIDDCTGEKSPSTTSLDNKKVTLEKMFTFICKDLVLAQYTEIQDNTDEEFLDFDEEEFTMIPSKTDLELEIGLIGQDVIASENPVKHLIVNEEKAKKHNTSLSCNQDNYINIIAGALKVACNKIEQLEKKVAELENNK
jgi:hypothetical protein